MARAGAGGRVSEVADDGIDVRRDGAVVSVRLDRPDARNALTTAMLDALRRELRAIADDTTARVVVLSGAGTTFCAGADLREIPPDAEPNLGVRRVRLVTDVLDALRRLEQPTIAAVHGAAIGAGWGLALMCDACLVTPDATFALPELPKGFRLPSAIVRRLVEVAGPVRAADLVYSGRPCDATEAVAIGAAARVLASDELHATASAMATTLAGVRRDRVAAARSALAAARHPATEFAWIDEKHQKEG
jgi:enoyl-CoA hydratase/carnithine racemase